MVCTVAVAHQTLHLCSRQRENRNLPPMSKVLSCGLPLRHRKRLGTWVGLAGQRREEVGGLGSVKASTSARAELLRLYLCDRRMDGGLLG